MDAASDALRHASMFNVIDVESGWKADMIIRKRRPFGVEEFGRRTTAQVMGVPVDLATPEDTILAKLEWSKGSDSERRWRDALGVAIAQRRNLDSAYLRKWAAELGVAEAMDRVLGTAGGV